MADEHPPSKHQEIINEDPNGFYDWALKRAKEGHVSDAQELLHGFLSYSMYNEPLPAAITTYLSEAFHRYLKSECDIDEALLLRRRKRGRKVGATTVNPHVVVAALYLKMKRDGMGKEDAKEAVEAEFPVGKRNLEKYDKEWNLIRDLEIDQLELLAALDTKRRT